MKMLMIAALLFSICAPASANSYVAASEYRECLHQTYWERKDFTQSTPSDMAWGVILSCEREWKLMLAENIGNMSSYAVALEDAERQKIRFYLLYLTTIRNDRQQ